jgi:hypothetical protein
MATSYAYLTYGVDLGDGEHVPVPDSYEPVPDSYEHAGSDVDTAYKYAVDRLYELIPDGQRTGETTVDEKEVAVRKHLGIEFEWHGSDDYPLLLMTLYTFVAECGAAVSIDFRKHAAAAAAARYEQRIREALRQIGVTENLTPGWLLTASRE